MNTSARWLRSHALTAVAAIALGSTGLRAAVNFTLSSSTVDNAFKGTLTLTITGLPTGQAVLVEKYADLNNNGAIDGSDVLVRSFTVTDGARPLFGGVRNTNMPGDDDATADGQIQINLGQPGIDDVFGAMVGSYVYRVSDATGSAFTPQTQAFTVTAHAYPQGVQGQITALTGGAPIPGAMIVLLTGDGNAVGGIIADATGHYNLPSPTGSYQVIAIAPGFVTDMSTANATVNASAFTTLNEALATGTSTISGQFTNVANGNPVAGIFVVAQSADNHITGGFTNSTGNYSLSTSATQWQLDAIDGQLAQKGFLKPQTKPSADTTGGNQTVNVTLTKATALIYGTVTDGTNPLSGVGVGANDQANLFSASGLSAPTSGTYSLGVVAGTWNGGLSTDQLPAGYIAGSGFNVTVTANQAVLETLVALPVSAHLQGTVTNLGVPVANVQVDAYQNGAGNGVSAQTDGSGNFDLGVNAGTWNVVLDSSSTSSNNLVSQVLSYPIADNQTINSIALHVISATGTISGTVKDLNANPIANASVYGTITISTVNYAANAQTDGTGHYSLPVVSGIWSLNAYANSVNFNQKFPNVSTSLANINFVPTVITLQPQPTTVPTGAPASFVIATNAPGSPTFQWQVSTNGGTVWNNLANSAPYSGVTTPTLAISAATNAMNTYRYRCVVTFTGTPGVENSFAGLLTVNPVAPNFTSQPSPQTVSPGQAASFTAQVNDGAATFQWQVSVNGGSTWSNLANNATYGGVTSATLTITNPTSALNGNLYRLVATDVVGATSNTAQLTVLFAGGDFNHDGQSDLVWQNTATGEHYIWLMSGAVFSSAVNLGVVSTDWTIAATGDLNGDGQTDLIWENTSTGERLVWLMNGTTYSSLVSLGTISTDWSIAGTGDFNGDGQTDIVWENKVTGERLLWLMNGTAFSSGVSLGLVPTDSEIAGVADFNRDGKPDLLMQSRSTGAVSIWLMNGTVPGSTVSLNPVLDPLPFNQIAGVGDFNRDGNPDIVFENTITGARSVMFLNGNNVTGSASLTTLPSEWILQRPMHRSAPVDFNGDGNSDLVWQNTATGERVVWFMNGTSYAGSASLGVVATAWSIAATGDFNGDGQADILWQNNSTGERLLWFMNGATYSSYASLGVVPTVWSIAATGDFNGDGQTDILWQNSSTGERVVWLMNGATVTGSASLGVVPTAWSIAGAGDFNADGQTDIIWQNTSTGDRVLWLMNGTTYAASVALGQVSPVWSIAGAGDFNGDGKCDLVWQNTSTGERVFWLMNGTAFSAYATLGTAPVAWSIRN